MHTLLIKPETEDQGYVQIKNVISNVEELGNFDIIGLTEDELGNSVLKRMRNVANIRLAMDDAGINTPIHVYGSLDPLTSVLYFLSGAELFDGLTWLRYGYSDGSACYRANYGVKHIGIDRSDDFVKAKAMRDNLGSLVELNHQMRKFLLNGDFAKFGINEKTVHEAYDLLCTKVPRLK